MAKLKEEMEKERAEAGSPREDFGAWKEMGWMMGPEALLLGSLEQLSYDAGVWGLA